LLVLVRRRFLAGLAVILPLVITLWLLGILLDIVDALSAPLILAVLGRLLPQYVEDRVFTTYVVPVIGILLTLLLIFLAGLLAANFLGREIVAGFDRLMMRLPLIRGIYGAARQVLDTFGFLTVEHATLRAPEREPLPGYSFVFLPTSPNPTSGWLVAVRDDEIVPLDMSIDQGFKLILSGALVLPPGWESST
jgi:uncharacterized membrane protein